MMPRKCINTNLKKNRLKVQRLPQCLRTAKYEDIDTKLWKITHDVPDNDFTPLVKQIIESNQSIHVDGRAGVGKSFLIKQLQLELFKLNKKYVSLAPTNKAARVINGKTIHKFIAEQSSTTMRESKLDYVFIDEISMVPEVFYKFFIVFQRLHPNFKKLLFVVISNSCYQ